MKRCLACLKDISVAGDNYHPDCINQFWQKDTPVFVLEYALSELEQLARENIAQRIVVPGVQPKISLGWQNKEYYPRLTIVDAPEGGYILKPPHPSFSHMPETEALSMLLARMCGIDIVPFLLIQLKSGELAYITRRIDRDSNGEKFPMEDACQFTERLTEHKYRGSYEQIAKKILSFAQNPVLDVVRFYEQVIVSFLIGNNDMHMKNFSLISFDGRNYTLAPAYDMVATQLLHPDDPEELALTLNGKKRKLIRSDFDVAMRRAEIPEKAIDNLWKRIFKGMHSWNELIDASYLPDTQKRDLRRLIKKKVVQLGLNSLF